jgi:hypothetical protein
VEEHLHECVRPVDLQVVIRVRDEVQAIAAWPRHQVFVRSTRSSPPARITKVRLILIADGCTDRYEFGYLLSHLAIRWRGWLQEQQRALSGYLVALWHATLVRSWYPSLLDVLQAAGEMGLPVGSYVRHQAHTPRANGN